MIIKEIVQIGNPLLRKKSKVVTNINSKKVKQIIKDLIDSIRHHDLVGIAATQIGQKLRIFVTEVRKTPTRNPKHIDKVRVYINPEIIWFSKKEVVIYEGCGSVAYGQLFGPVKRPEKITITAQDRNGKKFKLEATDLLSRVIQHEQDHLDGIEFTEKITDYSKIMSREEYIKRIRKLNKKSKS